MTTIKPFHVRLSDSLDTARGSIRKREGLLVTVEYDGHYGVGEATPLPGWTESYDACREALETAKSVADELDWGIALAKTDAPAARHGLSLALAEARARAEDWSLYRALGGREFVETVPVNATIGAGLAPEAVGKRAQEAVDDGFETLKLKVGTNGIEEDIERVRAIRDAVGEEVTLRVDANGAWTPDQAQAALDSLAALDVSYVEQPLPKTALDAHAELSGPVDIALDESLAAYGVDDIAAADAADVVVLKPMVLGGPDLTMAAARRAREAGIEPVVSNTVDAVVARTGAVHIAAAIPDISACGLATASLLDTDLGPDPAPVEDGEIVVPQRTGLGLPERL
ncbi:o-succinylbenzoate synthase [Halovenus aranensis]|uniref:o-succinylbenzoate synthase n=1 Tax=Halovenus aranensis TaxID=890420 RepID=A0A1G8W9R2_9EURY|nr:o-succinylbenzoate synthase [Halovenus aranensis]SDJ74886.1 o-succinylbenzoate synthase [Halovenus aranensis]